MGEKFEDKKKINVTSFLTVTVKSEGSVCKLVYSRLSTTVNTNITDEQTPISYRQQERVGRNKHVHASHRKQVRITVPQSHLLVKTSRAGQYCTAHGIKTQI